MGKWHALFSTTVISTIITGMKIPRVSFRYAPFTLGYVLLRLQCGIIEKLYF